MRHGFLEKKGERPQFRAAGSTLPWPCAPATAA